jgi:hypothetical protein
MKLNSTHFCFVKIKMLKCGGGDGSLGGGDMGGRGLFFWIIISGELWFGG